MASSSGPIRAAIFDYGGVLTTPGRVAILAWLERERIRPDTFSATLKAWLSRKAPDGTPLHRLETGELGIAEFNQLLAERLVTVDGGPVAAEGLLGRLFANMAPNPPMLELVRRVRDNGLRTAMLSNSWGNDYPWDHLTGLFEVSIVSGEVGLRKPDPRIYRMMLDRLGLHPHETVFVDDGAPNIEAADQLGMHTVLHENTDHTHARLAELLPEPPFAPTAEENR
ncbi:HAD family hydrolase [Parasphingorhabdus pacifica]